MNEAIVKKYRSLLAQDFPNSGQLDNPSIFVEAVGEKLINCGNTGNYMQIFAQVAEDRIVEIKYLCSCEPVANVVVEVFCDLVKGKLIDDVVKMDDEVLYQAIGSREEKVATKVKGIMELFLQGIELSYSRYLKDGSDQYVCASQKGKTNWDDNLSK